MVAAGGWWVAIVSLWPASSRPFIGGSQNNSLLNLMFGYNGFGRLSGNETGSVGGGGGGTGTGMWGATGLTRMFNSSFGAQASWLLPAALLLLATVLVLTITTGRTARTRAAMIVWGGWLVVTGLAFSLGQGIIHQYYTVALVPPIGAIIGIGVTSLWARRDQLVARFALAGTLGATAAWSAQLLHRTPTWHPELRTLVLVVGLLAAAAIACQPLLPSSRGLWMAVGGGALAVGLLGPGAYSLATAAQPHTGSIPTAGPSGSSQGGPGGAGGGPRGGFGGGFGGPPGAPNATGATGAVHPTTGATARGGAGGVGGILNGSTPSATLTEALQANAGHYTWVAAVVSANQAAGYQLAAGAPVMAIGGFNGTDPSPTLAQFQADVAAGRVHYFIAGGGGGGGAGGAGGQSSNGTASAITQWVAAHYTAQTVGGVTLYDLSA